MSASAPAYLDVDYSKARVPMAAFEVLACLAVSGAATLAFLAGWLTVNGAVVITVVLLATLIVLSWVHLGQGRHPCFLFLCTLMFFQGGRLLAYCLGGVADPMQVELMRPEPFNISRTIEGIVLLCIGLSAICIYAPCRWKYQPFPPPRTAEVRRYLPYLYLVFLATMPFQLFRNYRYFQWVQEHGGYLSIFQSHADLAASVPLFVRAIPLVSFPAFVAIFVFEHRKIAAYLTTALYLGSASLILLVGSRMAFFRLILTLWYVARVKSTRRAKFLTVAAFFLALSLVADAVGYLRENPDDVPDYSFAFVRFLAVQGQSMDVTSTVVAYRQYFEPFIWSYLFNDLQNAFVSVDTAHYQRGRELALDLPPFLNPGLFRIGIGTGSSYIGEAYLLGGVAAVAAISLLIGGGLHYLYYLSRGAVTLFLVALTLPEVLFMPRGALLDWVSALFRNAISIALLWMGWKVYALLTSIRGFSRRPEICVPPGSAC